MIRGLKLLFWMISLCLFTSYAHADGIPANSANPGPISTPQESPSLLVLENSHDFGEIDLDSEYTHDFEVRNIGAATFKIVKVAVS